jgi:sugar/nucleoside kinase (ribokinase family)
VSLDLIGVGSPLVDLVLTVDDEFLTDHVPGAKGGMELVESDQLDHWLRKVRRTPVQSAGGAASNTTVGCAHLGLATAFIGAIGDDATAVFYREALIRQGVAPRLVDRPGVPSGRVLSFVTPDAQRTMRTNLGASQTLTVDDVAPAAFAGARLVMLEGYTLFNHDLTRAIAVNAKSAGCQLALDLASLEVVRFNRPILDELLDGLVDIVFANEDEAMAWNPAGPQAALEDLAARTGIAVVKLGKDGALVASGSDRIAVPVEPVTQVVDTTGAGDTWAAGFLAGHLRGLPLHASATLGARCAAEVIQVMGATVAPAAWKRQKGWLDAWA